MSVVLTFFGCKGSDRSQTAYSFVLLQVTSTRECRALFDRGYTGSTAAKPVGKKSTIVVNMVLHYINDTAAGFFSVLRKLTS